MRCERCGQLIEQLADHEDPETLGPVHADCCRFCRPELAPPITERPWLTAPELEAAFPPSEALCDAPWLGHGARSQAQMERDEGWVPSPPPPARCGAKAPPALQAAASGQLVRSELDSAVVCLEPADHAGEHRGFVAGAATCWPSGDVLN